MDFNVDFSKVIVVGTIDSDIVMGRTRDGSSVSNFTIKYSTKNRDHRFDVSVFGDIGEKVWEELGKGYKVLVEGQLVENNDDHKAKILAAKVFPMELPF